MAGVFVFAPNGFGDLVMLSPFLRELHENRRLLGIVVKSRKHQELLEELGISGIHFFFLDTRSKISVLLLFLKLCFRRPVIIAPFLSTRKIPQLILALVGRKVFVPVRAINVPNAIEIESKFDQRGQRHLMYYLRETFNQVLSNLHHNDLLSELYRPVINKNEFLGNGVKRVLVCLSCGADERHKIPSVAVFAKFINYLCAYNEIEIICIGVQSDIVRIDKFNNLLDNRYTYKTYIDLDFTTLRNLISTCSLGVTGTTGQGHIASTCLETLVVFDGVTSDAASGPVVKNKCLISHQRECGPCYTETFLHGCGTPCMNDLGTLDDLKKFKRFFDIHVRSK